MNNPHLKHARYFIGEAISAIGGIASTAMTNRSNKRAQRRQFAFDKELMNLQHQNQLALNQDSYNKQVDFWNMQNEYNTPANQRKLAEEAGYNVLDVLRNGGSVSTAGQLSPVASGSAGLASVGLPPSANYAEGFASVASGLGSLAQAGLNKMKTKTEGFTQQHLPSAGLRPARR